MPTWNFEEMMQYHKDAAIDSRNSVAKNGQRPIARGQKSKPIRTKQNICACCRKTLEQYESAYQWETASFCETCYHTQKQTCVVCSTPFVSRVNNKKTCSAKCSLSFQRERAKAYQKKLKEAYAEQISFNPQNYEENQ